MRKTSAASIVSYKAGGKIKTFSFPQRKEYQVFIITLQE